MEGDVKGTAIGKISKAIGGGWSKEERNQRMFGSPPKGTYFGQPKDLAHAHDMQMSAETKKRLYGVGGGREQSVGDVVEARLGTDTVQGLVDELASETTLTRREAQAVVARWMQANDLEERNDPQLGKIIVARGSR